LHPVFDRPQLEPLSRFSAPCADAVAVVCVRRDADGLTGDAIIILVLNPYVLASLSDEVGRSHRAASGRTAVDAADVGTYSNRPHPTGQSDARAGCLPAASVLFPDEGDEEVVRDATQGHLLAACGTAVAPAVPPEVPLKALKLLGNESGAPEVGRRRFRMPWFGSARSSRLASVATHNL
jgi:hypothetical protein